jgi:hypothetical protein
MGRHLRLACTWGGLERASRGVLTSTYLATREANCNDTQLIAFREELWLDHGGGCHLDW